MIGVGIDDIEDARRRLNGVIRPTPARLADAVCRAVGRPVILKPEHLQRAGSFKIRGAYNCIAQLPSGIDVVAASAGNHAQGVALASLLTGHRATIFMPDRASLPKINATQDYGATVELVGPTVDDAIAAARDHAQRTGAVFVPPFDDPRVIAGQGTVGLELLDELDEMDALTCTDPNRSRSGIDGSPTSMSAAPPVVLVPVGGGGLISGIAIALRARRPDIRIVGVEAEGADSMRRSLETGTIQRLPAISTMADGIALKSPGTLTFEIVQKFVDDVITVNENEISQAVLLLLERAKAVVEPSGAVGLAALMAGKVGGDGPAVVVLSGGNVDPLLLTHLIEHGLTAAGRYLRVRVVAADRPGTLAEMTAAIAELGLNVVSVEHYRTGVAVSVAEVEILFTVETRGPEHQGEIVRALKDKGFKAELLQ